MKFDEYSVELNMKRLADGLEATARWIAIATAALTVLLLGGLAYFAFGREDPPPRPAEVKEVQGLASPAA